jgi:hypothetical protein
MALTPIPASCNITACNLNDSSFAIIYDNKVYGKDNAQNMSKNDDYTEQN